MYANKLLTVVIAVASIQASAQSQTKPIAPPPVPTIGQLADQARIKRLAEDSASKQAGAGTFVSPSGIPGGMPAGMNISVPSTQIINGAALAAPKAADEGKKSAPKKALPPPEFIPAILGIYKKGDKSSVELVEANGNDRFQMGQTTPSGWTVLAVGSQSVELGKVDPKSGVVRKITLHLGGI